MINCDICFAVFGISFSLSDDLKRRVRLKYALGIGGHWVDEARVVAEFCEEL